MATTGARRIAAGLVFFTIVALFATAAVPFASIAPVAAAGRTLYVSTTGSDTTGDGSSTKPWRTIGKSVSQVAAGDTVRIAAGVYAETITIEEKHGTAADPITFLAVGTVVIDGTASTRDAVFVTYSSYVVLDGWTVRQAPRAGLRIDASHHVTVRNGTFANNGRWGIFTDFSDDLLIENNEAYGSVAEHGIYHSNSGDRPTIRGNRIHDNYAAGLHMNADASMGGDGVISGALVENNVIWNNGSGGGAAINMDGITDSDIRNNVLYNNLASGIAMYQIDGAVCSQGNDIFNNTIVMADGGRWAIQISSSDCVNNRIFNNILTRPGTRRGAIGLDEHPISGLESDYNVVVNRMTINGGDSILTLAQWQALGHDAHSVTGTPDQLFVDPANGDFRLKTGSPAIDAGRTISSVTRDIAGNSRPAGNAYDAGAYESGTSAATATPTRTPTATSTATTPPTVAPSNTPTKTATATATTVPTNTATAVPPTATPTQTATTVPPATATQTQTAIPPTATPTKTATAVPPTATATKTATSVPPTATPTKTATSVPPTVTPTKTATPKPSPTQEPTATATPAPVVSPDCSANVRRTTVGGEVVVTCDGFLPGETVGLHLDTVRAAALASGTAGPNGEVTFSISMPETSGGRHALIAFGQTSRKRDTVRLTVDESLALSPKRGVTGTQVTVTLRGFEAGETVSIRWYETSSRSRTVVRGIVADGTGNATATFTVSDDATSGSHKVEARGSGGSRASGTFAARK